MTKIFTFLVGQSCRSALNSWAAQQRRPTEDVKIFVLHPFSFFQFIRWRRAGSAGRLTGLPAVAIIDSDVIMQTNVQTEDAIVQKTRELCETIVQQPQFQSIRQRVETFLADPEAQSQYECLSDLGQQLHDKQHQGLTLTSAEIAAFDRQRETFSRNAVAKAFVEAQEEMHQLQQRIAKYVSKTLELGAVPSDEDLAGGGSCGSGCGCHH